VKWDDGVVVEYRDTKVIFDPQVSNSSYSSVFVTHAHYDHAKGLHFPDQTKFSTKETRELVTAVGRVNVKRWNQVECGQGVKIDDLEIKAHNAGHILGSVQYEVTSPEGSLVYTGDFNFTDTWTMKAAEASPCDVLVVESTFGSPGFVFPSKELISAEAVQWAVESIKGGRTPVFQADSMGNAQELIRIFNTLTTLPVVTHPSVTRVNEVYEFHGYTLNYIDLGSEERFQHLDKHVLIVPKRLNLPEDQKFNVAYASGWALHLRDERKPFLLSDHADFPQLLRFVEEIRPRLVLTCHGGRFNETFARYVSKELQIEARPLRLIPTILISTYKK